MALGYSVREPVLTDDCATPDATIVREEAVLADDEIQDERPQLKGGKLGQRPVEDVPLAGTVDAVVADARLASVVGAFRLELVMNRDAVGRELRRGLRPDPQAVVCADASDSARERLAPVNSAWRRPRRHRARRG